MTSGNISLTDIIGYCLKQSSPKEVVLATWTAAEKSVQEFLDIIRAGLVQDFKIIADPSLVTRKPEIAEAMRFKYGDDSIRLLPLHAKWCVLTGGNFSVTIRTSMNLNPNRRIESYEISTCPEMAAYHLAMAREIFETEPPFNGGRQSQSQRRLDHIQSAAPTALLF